MTEFRHRSIAPDGSVVDRTISADTKMQAIERLQTQGFRPLRVDHAGSLRSLLSKEIRLSNNMPAAILAALFDEIGTLLKSGLQLEDCLRILSQSESDKETKSLYLNLLTDVRAGRTFSSALRNTNRRIPTQYVAIIRASEAAAKLDDACRQNAEIIRRKEAFQNEIIGAALYPFVLIVTAGGALFVIVGFVVPEIVPIFQNADANLPVTLEFLDMLNRRAGELFFLLALTFFAGVSGFVATRSNARLRLIADKQMLRAPLFGGWVRLVASESLTRTLGVLISANIEVASALRLAADTIANRAIRLSIVKAAEDVRAGRTLSSSLNSQNLLTDRSAKLLIIGERSGNLGEILQSIASDHERDIRSRMKQLTTIFPPLVILSMGLIIGFIVFSIMTALFQLNEIAMS